MAVITKITSQQKNSERYNIYLDFGHGEQFAFSVDADVLIKFNLKKGLEIDDLTLSEIEYSDEISKALNLSVKYLARRMRSEHEIRAYLQTKDVNKPVIDEVVHKLYGLSYLNDEKFAKAYVRTQMKTTDKGPCIISKELKEKGVSGHHLYLALDEFTTEVQIEKATKLYHKFVEKNKQHSRKMLLLKVEQMLIRKGYSSEVISIVNEEAMAESESEKELEALRIQGIKFHKRYSTLPSYEYEQKMKQALFRKGFSIELINQLLKELGSN